MKWSVVLFCVIIWNALFGAAVGDVYPLTVEGVGTVTVPADIVTISVSVESSNENITQAQYEVGEEMNRVISALKKAGVKDEEILPGQGSGISSFQSSSKVCKTVNNTTVCENVTESASTLQRSTVIRLQAKDESRIDKVLNAARSAGANAYVA
ncbi:MAG TPA: SIMPL domain-containing protein, partial [Methanothrix soehngenii]|nr:SIMPL domain-containing protein [Methanothrix soehngenii]